MKNKAASAQDNGAAFAAFRKNLGLLLSKRELRIVTNEPEQAFRDLFLFWSTGMQTYFQNLKRMNLSLSAETNSRWLLQAMVVEIGNFDASVKLPEECRAFLEFGDRFFGIFFRECSGGVDNGDKKGEDSLSSILIDLAKAVLAAVFLTELAMFVPACSDGRSARGTAGAQIIMFAERGEQVH